MSFVQFASAENEKIIKTRKLILAVTRFKQMGKQGAIKRRTAEELANITQKKDELTLKDPGTVSGFESQSTSDINGVENFCKNIKGVEDLESMPFMTYGLKYVLNDNGLQTIAQLVAKFIQGNDGVSMPKRVCKRFQNMLDKMTKNTIVEGSHVTKANITKVIARYAAERGLMDDDDEVWLNEEWMVYM